MAAELRGSDPERLLARGARGLESVPRGAHENPTDMPELRSVKQRTTAISTRAFFSSSK